MGMGLEFIDISKDEENEIPRASNGSNARRMSGHASQRRSRAVTPVMIDMEERRGVRTERHAVESRAETRMREPGTIRLERSEEFQEEIPVRRRPRLDNCRPPQRRQPSAVTPMLSEEE
ncbi:MAG: hypothetical protein K2O16_08895, partial [Lachnospiraceae bacterium]|nr:hypothetical protein [Lachnospiraceae bacterium]